MKKYFVLMVLSTVLAQAGEVTLPRAQLGPTGSGIQEWRVLGPFQSAANESALNDDFLKASGTSEAACAPDHFSSLCAKADPSQTGVLYADDMGRVGSFAWHGLGQPSASQFDKIYYLGCEIIAENETSAWLMVGTLKGTKLWVNGKGYWIGARAPKTLPDYVKTVEIHLNKGSNFLLVKTAGLALRIEPSLNSATQRALSASHGWLNRAVVPAGQSLEVSIPCLPDSVQVSMEIQTRDGARVRIVGPGPLAPLSTSELSSGLYRLVIRAGSARAEQSFYVGSVDDILAKIEVLCQKGSLEDRVKINLRTLSDRLEFLHSGLKVDPWDPESKDFINQPNIIETIGDITDTLELIDKGEEPFRNRTGLHLRGFCSRIDDQIQHYRLFVPSNYRPDGAGLPLVIVPAPVFERSVPYIESSFLRNKADADGLSQIAESLGVGILWSGYRIRPYGNPLDLAHLDEVLAAVAADYKIDTSRLYLWGVCSTGMTVAMDALRHPSRYAAIAYYGPFIHRQMNRWDGNWDYAKYPNYQRWLHETDPLAGLAALPGVPVWIIFDKQINPTHGPLGSLSEGNEFLELSRANGNHAKLDLRDGMPIDEHDVFRRELPWLASQRRSHPGPLLFPKQPPNGPLSRVFAERFIVVKGTHGSELERQASERWCKAFCDAWQATNYGPCRVIADSALDPAEEKESNLVLIGNSRTNVVWARLDSKLPVQLSAESISVNGKTWAGDALAVEAWCPHPEIAGRKIALIGAADLDRAQVGTMELALDGWFDFGIWAIDSGKPRLKEAGRYDL